MTTDQPAQPADPGTSGTPAAAATPPRLADRLSALVGQAASRQEEPGGERLTAALTARLDASAAEVGNRLSSVETAQQERLAALEALVASRLDDIDAALAARLQSLEAAVEQRLSAVDEAVRAHVDEVGGALVLRLDDVASGWAHQPEGSLTRPDVDEAVSSGVATVAAEVADITAQLSALAAEFDGLRGSLAGLATAEHVEGLVRPDQLAGLATAGDLAALATADDLAGVARADDLAGVARREDLADVARVSDVTSLASRDDLEAVAAGVGAVLESVAQTEQAAREQSEALAAQVADATGAVRDELRADLDEVETRLAHRIDEAALALAETLVPLLAATHGGLAPVAGTELEDEADLEWPAADDTETLVGLDDDYERQPDPVGEAERVDLTEESFEQGVGTADGGVLTPADGTELETSVPSNGSDSARRRTRFRR